MKKAIVTYVEGQDFEEVLNISEPLFKDYAQKCGSDYIALKGNKKEGIPTVFSKCNVVDAFAEYDRCLFLDADIVIQNDPPNMFELFPEEGVHGVDMMPHLQYFPHFWKFNNMQEHASSQNITFDKARYVINAGVMQISKNYADLFRFPEYPVTEGMNEQSLWNVRIHEANCFHPIPLRWNCTRNLPCFYHEYKHSYFIHFNVRPVEKKLAEMTKLINEKVL